MAIDQKLREHLSPRAAAEAGFDALPDDLWEKIDRRIGVRRRNTAARVAAVAIAAAISIATFLLLINAFRHNSNRPPAVHPTVPPFQLTISKIQVSDNTGTGEVDGVVTNLSNKPLGAQITCEVRTGQGSLLNPFTATVSYLAPGRSATFAAQPPPESGVFPSPSAPDAHATAKCGTSALLATHPTPPPPPVFHPTQIVFWNSQNGIATGILGPLTSGSKPWINAVEETTDGGKTWITLSQTSRLPEFVDVAGSGSDNLWAVGGSRSTVTKNHLLRSVDGGKTWLSIFIGPLHAISFTSATDGFGVFGPASDEVLETTVDGGRNWTAAPVPPCRQMGLPGLVDLSFINRSNGWIVCTGGAATGEMMKAVLETTDGGKTWFSVAHALSVADSVGMSVMGYPAGLTFLPDGSGWMWQDPYRGRVQLTQDGGHSWGDANLPDGNQVSAVISMWSTQDAHAFALRWDISGRERTDLLTLDAGGRWVVVYTWGP